MMNHYFQAMVTWVAGRSITVTKSGHLCLAQDGIAAGDIIAVLRGGITPFVLRPAMGGDYQILCDVYVHGLMKGEALERLALNQEICLV